MALSDLADKDGEPKSKPGLAIAVHMPPVDPIVAMGRFLKALKANDAEAAYDALCLVMEAHEEKLEEANEKEDDGDEY